MKKIIVLIILAALCVLLVNVFENSHRFSPHYRLYEWSLDGDPWFSLETNVPGQGDGPPFCQYVDGVQQVEHCVYVWVNGRQHPDYYVIDLRENSCTRLSCLPGFVKLQTAEQFLREH